ncbi:hemerythrin domain-containing protein [Streptomyces sp. SID8381]|uniref:hemerythrin domain-containing protein n=1 Tax=unclassified Streptomyces TaxID=2593676 RepID=UPI0003A8E018|nr:hemerythrin domain-containing protein [Streptomyces sp. Amel2xE9]MYX30661.1 hemerythrin domain-containing protein [Streptomyces sp. SID8381]
MDGRSGVVAELTAEHARVRSLFDRIRAARPGGAERTALVERAAAALVRHAVAEKAWLYPAVRRYVPDGDDRAERELRAHREVEELLASLTAADPADEEFTELLVAVVARVTRQFVEQEQTLFPRLEAGCPREVLRDLGDRVRATEAAAPTRPRPAAPEAAPLVRLTAQVWGPLDRLRDRSGRRGRE